MRGFCIVLAAILFCVSSAFGAIFQYRVSVETEKGERDGFLWVPAEAERIRGVVISGMTLMEREFAKDSKIRAACAEEGLAIVFLKCGLGQADVQKVLDDFAEVSGYEELSAAPLMFVGHSAGGPPAKALSIEMADRCLGVVQYRGGVPGGRESVRSGVPALMMIGQFDEFGGTMRNEEGRETWEGGRDGVAAFQAQNEGNLGSIVVESGAGHFAWSDRNAQYLALFIRKAAQARIPKSGDGAALKEIDYRRGWLSDLSIEAKEQFTPAPYEEYKGDKSKAAWHFDEEMARATVAFHSGGFGKKDQFIKWDDPYWVDAGTRFFFTELTWVGDGQTLEVHPVYADVHPSQHEGRGPRWLEAGKPVGHSDSPILVRHVSGPMVAVGGNRLRVHYDALAPATEELRVTFMAYSAGDGEYRYTEQVGMMPRGFKGLTKGKEQTITFAPLDDLAVGGGGVELKATSDSGLPVEYHVAYGPAVIEEGKLGIAELPVRARFPMEVKVVAYQFGSGVEPLVKTATPIEQIIRIRRR